MHDRPFSLGGDLEITAVAPTSAAAVQAMRAYICDVASSYYRRPATTAEVQAALAQHPAMTSFRPRDCSSSQRTATTSSADASRWRAWTMRSERSVDFTSPRRFEGWAWAVG